MTTATAPTKPTKALPAELEPLRTTLENCAKIDGFGDWPEHTNCLRALAPEELAKHIRRCFHPNLRSARIAFLWVESMQSATRIKLGTAAKASGKVRLIGEVDFILTFNHTAWKNLSFEQRVALVDHELCHCDIDSETARPVTLSHDIEEFSAIVMRHGLWKPDVRDFVRCAKDHMQGDLFSLSAADPELDAIVANTVNASKRKHPVDAIMKTVVDAVNRGELDTAETKVTASLHLHEDFENHPKPPAASKVTPIRAD